MADKRLKVVHLITLLEFGGAQGNTLHTVKNLDKNRFDAELWTGRGAYWDQSVIGDESLKSKTRFLRFLVRPINPLFDAIALLQLWWALVRSKPDILHTHSSKAGILGRVAGRLARVPVIIHTFHGFGFHKHQSMPVKWAFIFHERLVAKFSHALIFVSKMNWETAKHYSIGDEKRYHLIRSGVPIQKIQSELITADKPRLRQELGLPQRAPIVVTIGAFKPQKNLSDFIDMAFLVKKEVPNSFFVLLGDGVLRASLEEKAKQSGLIGSVMLPGWRSDAARFLAASDVFAMTSLWEGLPRSLVEAMCLGLPSVCYETDGTADLLSKEEGTLIQQGDMPGLASKVVSLLNNKEERTSLGKAQQARVGIEFDIDHMVRQQEDLYAKVFELDNLRRKH